MLHKKMILLVFVFLFSTTIFAGKKQRAKKRENQRKGQEQVKGKDRQVKKTATEADGDGLDNKSLATKSRSDNLLPQNQNDPSLQDGQAVQAPAPNNQSIPNLPTNQAAPNAQIAQIQAAPVPVDTRSTVEILDQNINSGITWVKNNPGKSLASTLVGSVLLYKIFEKSIKNKIADLRSFCESKFFDAWEKWEIIKQDGLTKLDCVKGFIALCATGSLGALTYYNGIDNSKKHLKQLVDLTQKYKIELGAVTVGIALGRWLYKIKVSLDNRRSRVLSFDKFIGSLTEEQRRIIFNSEDLLVAVGKGGDNQKRLLQNEQFMELLTENQKSYLQNIVRYRCSAVENVL